MRDLNSGSHIINRIYQLTRLLELGKNTNPEIKDINNLMVKVGDENYSSWTNLEDHLSLEMLNGILL